MTFKKKLYVPKPTFEHAVTTWLLHWEGWYQSEIAGYINTNPGRINDIIHGRSHPDSKAAALIKNSA